MSTPAGRSKDIRLSIVLLVGSMTSNILLWILISNCSKESLWTCGERRTDVNLRSVGKGIGPLTRTPVFSTISMIFKAALSKYGHHRL